MEYTRNIYFAILFFTSEFLKDTWNLGSPNDTSKGEWDGLKRQIGSQWAGSLPHVPTCNPILLPLNQIAPFLRMHPLHLEPENVHIKLHLELVKLPCNDILKGE